MVGEPVGRPRRPAGPGSGAGVLGVRGRVAPEPGEHRLRGRLQGTVHGGISPHGFPPCAGRVDRIRLLTQQYVEYQDRHFRGVPGTVTTTDLAACPTAFPAGLTDGAYRPFGVLLDVSVPVSPVSPAG